MNIENGTLKNYVESLIDYKPGRNHLSHHFRYEGVPCTGLVTITPWYEELRIMPNWVKDDIGKGCGAMVTMKFKRQQNKPNMNFGEALASLKEGKKVARSVWGGYWVMVDNAQIRDFRGLPMGLKADYHMKNLVLAMLRDNKGIAPAQPYWEDMWAEDWFIVE